MIRADYSRPEASPVAVKDTSHIDLPRQIAALGVPRLAVGWTTPDNGVLLVKANMAYLAVTHVVSLPAPRVAAQRFIDLFFLDRESA